MSDDNLVIVSVGDRIYNKKFQGYFERAYYAGMPDTERFSIIFESVYTQTGTSATKQFFYPIKDLNEVTFREGDDMYKVKRVTPSKLEIMLE